VAEVTKKSFLDACLWWALANKFWVVTFTGAFLAFTVTHVNELSIDAVPDITNVQVVVNTKTQGLDPEKVELTVTQPIEYEMMGLAKLADMRSISKFGLSQVTLIFDDATDVYWARQQVSEKLQAVLGQLPAGVAPELAPISTGLGEVYMYALSLRPGARGFPNREAELLYLRELQDFEVRPRLRRIRDVADVDSNGGYRKELHINIDPRKLIALGLTLDQVERKLAGLGESFGGGSVTIGNEALILKTSANLADPAEIERISLGLRFNGAPIHLRDFATVSYDAAPRLGSATLSGAEAVLGTVLMKSGGNGRVVSSDVEAALAALKLPPEVALTKLYSRAFLVNTTLKTVVTSLAEGAVLVILVLLALLGHVRAALIVSFVIPLSMLGTTLGMRALDISGNLMSLGAIDFGLVVDGAVVLVETLIAGLAALSPEERRRRSKDELVYEKARLVVRPVVFGLFLIMLVYLPILLLEGIEGKMFRPMAYTVLLTLGWSLLFTVFLVPVLVAKLVPVPAAADHGDHDTLIFRKLRRWYAPILERSLGAPKLLFAGGLLLLALATATFLRLGVDFIPQLDEGDLVINLTRDSRISLEEALRQQVAIEAALRDFPEVEKVFSRLGTPESATDPMGVHLTDMFLILNKDRSTWRYPSKDALFVALKTRIEGLSFAQELSSTQPIEMRFNEMLEGSRADVSLRVLGPELAYLMEVIETFERKVASVPGLEGAEMDPLTALRKSRVIDVKPDFAKLAALGISLDEFNQTIVSFMRGTRIGSWVAGTRKYPLMIHLSEEFRHDLVNIRTLPVRLPEGGTVPLASIARIDVGDQVTTIARNWGERYAALSLNIAGRDTMGFVNDVRKLVRETPVKPGHRLHLGGQFNNLERARARLLVIIPLTLLLILFILWREFASVADALVIFLCVPFAAFGGVFALSLRDINLSLSAAVGFIALIGIALLNGIVLLTVFRQLRPHRATLRETVIEGTLSRLRPVVMTALVASLGFVPMALNTGLGSEVQRPLATVVIGGILFSTVLTLVFLPSMYLWLRGRADLG
jgi:cobalt-zinc-cadmium resistance protein CzcA